MNAHTLPQAPKPAFARRGIGYSANGSHETTFVSTDRADEHPVGWFHGYVEDGAVWNGYVLTHVGEPSWRCAVPVMGIGQAVAA